jgi:hypothetical protein
MEIALQLSACLKEKKCINLFSEPVWFWPLWFLSDLVKSTLVKAALDSQKNYKGRHHESTFS